MNYTLSIGDIVKLKDPYRPEESAHRKPKTWRGFEYGIVVEIVSTQFTVNGDLYGNIQIPRNVSLHLYDASRHLLTRQRKSQKESQNPQEFQPGKCRINYCQVNIHPSSMD